MLSPAEISSRLLLCIFAKRFCSKIFIVHTFLHQLKMGAVKQASLSLNYTYYNIHIYFMFGFWGIIDTYKYN